MNPGQPYPNPHQVSPLLKQIDYLVAYLWELEGFAFSDEARYDPELLSDDLLSRGLRSLCLLSVPNGGSIYERGKPIAQLPRMPGRIQEGSVTRDAFCAALAARLIETARAPRTASSGRPLRSRASPTTTTRLRRRDRRGPRRQTVRRDAAAYGRLIAIWQPRRHLSRQN